MRTNTLVPVALLLMADHARSAVMLTEGFDAITSLPGKGWSLINISNPVGTTGWFQGNSTFPAHAGPTTSFIAANYNNTTNGSPKIISNWLMTPGLDFSEPLDLSFWTRTAANSLFPDRLEVRLSTQGASSSTADFSKVLLSINPSLAVGGYPSAWTNYSLPIVESGTGRLAFHYFVTNGGPFGTNSNFIGIDTVSVTSITAIPEPSGWFALATFLASGTFLRIRKDQAL